ncbi:hypothetical protein SAMN04244553_3573 [Nocardia amikacinitolerans]|uniref:Uncharacterized protein n=1 Tax=Nocardia amikacinitolerans TaxID=756689 RepID=A0A285LG91_9NOCA|nr:hypothetical protein [Nocardia amikacinitolerans]SNY83872.1 hypothetical protein SAMN04244553_3573 [Nocardia amikacinitolerans]
MTFDNEKRIMHLLGVIAGCSYLLLLTLLAWRQAFEPSLILFSFWVISYSKGVVEYYRET